jgi:biotin carboxylase
MGDGVELVQWQIRIAAGEQLILIRNVAAAGSCAGVPVYAEALPITFARHWNHAGGG